MNKRMCQQIFFAKYQKANIIAFVAQVICLIDSAVTAQKPQITCKNGQGCVALWIWPAGCTLLIHELKDQILCFATMRKIADEAP